MVRSAAVHADVVVQALYMPVCVAIPSQVDFEVCLDEVQAIFHLLGDDWQAIYLSDIKPVIIEGHIELRNRFPAAQSQHFTTTYVGTVPSRDLACHAACSVIIPATFCSNCNVKPVAVHPRCFADWCQRCDYSSGLTDAEPDHVLILIQALQFISHAPPVPLISQFPAMAVK